MRLFKSHMYYISRYISSNLWIYLLYFLNISSLSYGYIFSILWIFSVLHPIYLFCSLYLFCFLYRFYSLYLLRLVAIRDDEWPE